MIRFSLIVFVFSLSSFFSSYAAEPVVLVQHNGLYQGYFSKPRLSDVVTPLNKVKDLYWPAASLYILDANELAKLEQQKQSVLKQLADLRSYFVADDSPELADSVEKLTVELGSIQLAKKIFIPLDPDRVRAKKSLNPVLDAGQYLLQVSGRPEQIVLFGLVQQQTTPLLNASSLTTYMEALTVMEGASSSFVYLLPPGSSPILAKTGLWNSSYQAVPPGSTLYVPFEDRKLPEQFKNMNQQIVDLLVHKVDMQ